MWSYLASWWRGLPQRYRWLNYMCGSVLKAGPEIWDRWGAGTIQWRIKRTQDGAKKFVSVRITPSLSYGPKGSPHCFLSLDLESARLALDGLNEIIEELESEPHRESAKRFAKGGEGIVHLR
jgi:hypothetical protein